jgi:hypothetical protein
MNETELVSKVFSTLIENAVSEQLNTRFSEIQRNLDEITNLLKEMAEDPNKDRLLNKKDACKLLKTTYPTLRSWMKKGIVKPAMSEKGVVRFSQRELMKIKRDFLS